MTYASFWKRAAAYVIDEIIYYVIICSLTFVCGVFLPDKVQGVFMTLVLVACYLTYYVWMESSSWQATIGKKILDLKVTDENGQRISFMRSLVRHLGMFLSGITLCIGYLMCFWTEQSQCLHDKIAGCLVFEGKDPRNETQKMDNWTPPELDLSELKPENGDTTHAPGMRAPGSETSSKVGTMDVIK